MEAVDSTKSVYRHACPSCEAKLRIPAQAIGQFVNCPGCRVPFEVPRPAFDIDEMVSEWIQDGVDDIFTNREDKMTELVMQQRAREELAAAHRAKVEALIAEQMRTRRDSPTPRPKPATRAAAPSQPAVAHQTAHGMMDISNVIAA